jgi:transcriptional regulator with XRE-family HTH domain
MIWSFDNAIVAMKRFPTKSDAAEIQRRLQVVRYLVAGDNQAEFARRLGVSRTRWNNIECGYPMSLNMAYMLTNLVPGLTIEWLTEGRDGYLPAALRTRLKDAEASLFPSSPAKRSAKI